MELGDIIFPLLLIGGAIVQWLSSRNKEEPQDSNPQPRQDNPYGTEPTLDDLMEALGQPAAPPELPTLEKKREVIVTPPPIAASQPPEIPVHVNLIDRQREQLEQKKKQLESIQAQSGKMISHLKKTSAATVTSDVSFPSTQLRQVLYNRKSLKQAIVLNEILQPPVSLR